MYEIRAERTNKKAQSLIILFFAGAAALLLLSVPLKGLPFLWIIQLFAIVLLGAAVFLVTRYVARGYIYRIEEGDLTVIEISSGGRRQIAVCRVALSGISEADVYNGSDAAKRYKGKRIYDYRPDLMPERSIALLSREGGEESVILLGYSGELLSFIGKK